MQKYRHRIADKLLKEKLEAMGAVVIEGAKWCGKTTTAQQAANSSVYLANSATLRQYQDLIDINPTILLNGEPPMLVDEWQEAPKLWDAIRYEIDHRNKDGQFILTGSAAPNERKLNDIHHTGTGRFGWVKMRPMSLYESGESTSAVSFKKIFESHVSFAVEAPDVSLHDIAYLICRGGWPASLSKKSPMAALIVAEEYYKGVVHSDVSKIDGVNRNPEKVKKLMRSLARHQGTQASISTLIADINQNEIGLMSSKSISEYINVLKNIFVIEDSIAWNPNLRSKSAIRSADTRYFVDSSIAAAALEIGPDDLINDIETMGLLFETMAVRDLRCYADALNGEIYHFRDKTGLECDAVMHLKGGKYGLIEIKLGGDKRIDEGAESLKFLASKIDDTRMKSPSFLMVLTAVGKYAYTRKDGVIVAPISTLCP